jgi:hypothetical protein
MGEIYCLHRLNAVTFAPNGCHQSDSARLDLCHIHLCDCDDCSAKNAADAGT